MIDSFKGEYHWLSNFWDKTSIHAFGVLVDTVEHGYQAAKCVDPDVRMKILMMARPGQCKRAGRLADIRSDWDDVKEYVMMGLLRRKFADEDLRERLLDTGDETLVEGNQHKDSYWGALWTATDALFVTPSETWPDEGTIGNPTHVWQGQNRLGVLLMELRNEIALLRGL